MKKIIALIAVLLVALPACTIITDFSEPDGDLYSLDDNMTAQVAVALGAGDAAQLTLSFTEQLPGSADDNEELLGLITGGTIDLVVSNDVTGVSFNLVANGTQVETPAGPGEYNVALGSDRNSLVVGFYNEVSGAALHAEGSYTAAITVNSNDWFLAESFTRAVAVQ